MPLRMTKKAMASKRAAVIPAKGIGDALLMMIASHHLAQAGYQVTTFHPHLPQLSRWFPGHAFADTLPADFHLFERVIFENDNSPQIQKLPQGSIFYPTYKVDKHGPLAPLDKVFNPQQPMAANIAHAIGELCSLSNLSKANGLTPPIELTHKKNPRQIVIHPFSSQAEKNWIQKKFIKLAHILEKRGLSPVFAMSPEERLGWKNGDFPVPHFPNLDALACFVYESGGVIGNDSLLGHLASNMGLPSLILADDRERMRLWQPGWEESTLLTPSPWIPRRLRKVYWKRWITLAQAAQQLNLFLHCIKT